MFGSIQAGLLLCEKRENCWLKMMSRAAAEVCGENVSAPPTSVTALPDRNRTFARELVDSWFTTAQLLDLLSAHSSDSPAQARWFLPLRWERKNSLYMFPFFIVVLMEYYRVLQYQSEAAGAAVPH